MPQLYMTCRLVKEQKGNMMYDQEKRFGIGLVVVLLCRQASSGRRSRLRTRADQPNHGGTS